MAEILQQKPSAFAAQASASAAQQILDHKAPAYKFSFTPFLFNNYRMGISPDRPTCKAYLQGHCPLGTNCPDKHATNPNNSWNFNNMVCKHWLRGLCKKGETCEFLHEFNLRKMPECNFFVKNGYCSNGDECLYLHVDPASKMGNCPHYDKGFCPLGPRCSKKHIRKALCEFYLAGFCPDGPKCKKAHPRWPSDLPKPTIKVERDPEEVAEEQARIRENAEREADRERGFGEGRPRQRWRGGFSYRGRGGGGERGQRGRGH
ncbi:hypothetical protein BPAE_0016g00220 [Botrytis paeoniae]|uniref:mRNA 3'-end-processing protein n=1 Tax=Botrytis paeoniae TaxID=278948 RepID=A0A4Z1G1A0_9HELO|nr:hypothetical protein BPAE_0016g00220 [Botrytis paeoniae]